MGGGLIFYPTDFGTRVPWGMESMYLEIHMRSDGQWFVRFEEDGEPRDVQLGNFPGYNVQVDPERVPPLFAALVRKAFWAGASHANFLAARDALRRTRSLKRKLK